jgi:hypothetical protein
MAALLCCFNNVAMAQEQDDPIRPVTSIDLRP